MPGDAHRHTFNIGDDVEHVTTGKFGMVVNASLWWGWYEVEWEDGFVKKYEQHGRISERTVVKRFTFHD